MISVRFQRKPFNITVIQVYAPTSNAEEAEQFYEDLQDLLELTPKKDVLFIIGDWNAKGGSQEIPGVTGKFGLGIWNEAGQRLIEFCQEKELVIANTLFQQQTLLPSPVTSTTGCCFCFGSVCSFFLELFLRWSPVAHWAPTNLGSSSFSWGSQGKNTEVVCHSLFHGPLWEIIFSKDIQSDSSYLLFTVSLWSSLPLVIGFTYFLFIWSGILWPPWPTEYSRSDAICLARPNHKSAVLLHFALWCLFLEASHPAVKSGSNWAPWPTSLVELQADC